ncbi:hypothetical protein SLOPH_1016 [Spraguea lophii 42_110]|uniref:Uncharacterized protein n=1 Tax=Spraguea lophii (strain 42_110) TaxID=1358809 RepID=S7XS80_SPRLO|nr:hypothetical protein SLOPH_1016 [Spraguea lophii 42_110]
MRLFLFFLGFNCKYNKIYNFIKEKTYSAASRSELLFFNSGSYSLILDVKEEFDAYYKPIWFYMSTKPISHGFSIRLHDKKIFIDITSVTEDSMIVKHRAYNPHLERSALLNLKFDNGIISTYSMEQVDDFEESFTMLKIYLKEKSS